MRGKWTTDKTNDKKDDNILKKIYIKKNCEGEMNHRELHLQRWKEDDNVDMGNDDDDDDDDDDDNMCGGFFRSGGFLTSLQSLEMR